MSAPDVRGRDDPDSAEQVAAPGARLELRAGSERDELAPFLGEDVVLDTRGELLYLGRLAHVGEWFLELADADVHDMHESRTSKELYVMDAARHGVKKNRRSVHVRKVEVISISRLSDVIQY